jgi:predicted LPLAT superfamily acyltransferase
MYRTRGEHANDYTTDELVFVAYNAKHAELRRKSKDWLPRNQDNVSEWSDMYIHGLLFPLANTIKKN